MDTSNDKERFWECPRCENPISVGSNQCENCGFVDEEGEFSHESEIES